MAAGRHSITLKQGDPFYLKFKISTNVDNVDEPWDLTGWSARMQVRQFAASTKVVLQLDNTYITMDNVGNVIIDVNGSITSSLPTGRHQYDIELIPSAGNGETILEGPFIVTEQVTR